MVFIIIAAVLLVINVVFLLGSILYTIKSKDKPRASLAPSIVSSLLQPRLSIQPQVALYQTMVRLSTGAAPTMDEALSKDKPVEQEPAAS